jgi:hypothetical protein
MSKILKINEDFMKSLACKNVHFVYEAEYIDKMVKKARNLMDCPNLVANMEVRGFHIPVKGEPNPFKSVIKHQEYGVTMGSSLSYTRMQEKKLAKNGVEADYEPSFRKPYAFPIWNELVYLSLDFETIYFRAYPMADGGVKPEAFWTVDGVEKVSKYVFAPWANSKEFNLWAHNKINRSVFKDEKGHVVESDDGDAITLRETIMVKFENCKLLVNDEDIRSKMFEKVSFYSDAQLVEMRDKYLEKVYAEYERKHTEWKQRHAVTA